MKRSIFFCIFLHSFSINTDAINTYHFYKHKKSATQHKAPIQGRQVMATCNNRTVTLFFFCYDEDPIELSIYKDGELIATESFLLDTDDILECDLSEYTEGCFTFYAKINKDIQFIGE